MRGLWDLLCLQLSQWRAPDELAARRDRRLSRLVRHAYDRVPYYRRLFDSAGVNIDEIRGADDLARIPITTKKDLQGLAPTEVTARGVDPTSCLSVRTSGATGVPLEIISRRADRSAFSPSFLSVYLAWGLKPWQRMTFFQVRPEVRYPRSWYERCGLFRRQILSSADPPEAWIEALRTRPPALLHGYALTLKLLASALRDRGVKDVRIPLIVSTSGMLDDPGRALLEEVLGGRVVDIYASEEAGSVIAWQCPVCREYHLNMETLVVEILRDGRPAGPGEEGSVVITNLANYTMPFIRYEQGDVARVSTRSPSCGRGLPLMASVTGRSGDCVILPSGKKLTPHPFFIVLDEAAGVGEWQLTQERVDFIRLTLTLASGADPSGTGSIVASLQDLVGPDVRVEVAVVDRIRRDAYQKLRSVVSKVTEVPPACQPRRANRGVEQNAAKEG